MNSWIIEYINHQIYNDAADDKGELLLLYLMQNIAWALYWSCFNRAINIKETSV